MPAYAAGEPPSIGPSGGRRRPAARDPERGAHGGHGSRELEGAITRRGHDRLHPRAERGPPDDALLGQRPLAALGERRLRGLDGGLGEQAGAETTSWRAAAVSAIASEKPALRRQRPGATCRSASEIPGLGNSPASSSANASSSASR
jgi:hypothetical protein